MLEMDILTGCSFILNKKIEIQKLDYFPVEHSSYAKMELMSIFKCLFLIFILQIMNFYAKNTARYTMWKLNDNNKICPNIFSSTFKLFDHLFVLYCIFF